MRISMVVALFLVDLRYRKTGMGVRGGVLRKV